MGTYPVLFVSVRSLPQTSIGFLTLLSCNPEGRISPSYQIIHLALQGLNVSRGLFDRGTAALLVAPPVDFILLLLDSIPFCSDLCAQFALIVQRIRLHLRGIVSA
jgi:hypothetical protein